MYVRHYGLSARPFQLTPGHRFFYPSRAHRAALQCLVETLEGPSGIALLTGETGVGRTTLLEVVASIVARRRLDLVRSDVREPLAPQLRALIQGAGGRPRILVLGDDAETLSEEDLGSLRRLLDRADGDGSPVHAVLAGPPSTGETMAGASAGPVRARILASHQIEPLGPDEIRPYVEHRLARAGWSGRPAFADSVGEAIHRHTGGNPRAINLLMSRVLLLGALDRLTTIDRFALDRAAAGIADEDAPLHPTGVPPPPVDTPPVAGPAPPPTRDSAGPAAPPTSDADDPVRSELDALRRQLYRLDLERLRQDTETSRRLVAALLRQNERRTTRRFPFLPRFARSF